MLSYFRRNFGNFILSFRFYTTTVLFTISIFFYAIWINNAHVRVLEKFELHFAAFDGCSAVEISPGDDLTGRAQWPETKFLGS